MTFALSLVFFASGASALVFETLWFHQAGLALGNSLWASSLVLAGFMGGLALGNALAARWGDRLADPVRAYAWLEVAIAVTGVGLVVLLAPLGGFLATALRPLAGQVWLLNAFRLTIAFALLLVPSTAMGCTLPLLTQALTSSGAKFGRTLGGLYGWNTLGAVVGAIVAETHLIGALGIRGTALAAGAANLSAAGVAGILAARNRRSGRSAAPVARAVAAPVGPAGRSWLAVAFVSGFVLLALEVVWFRFLALFVLDRSISFAMMLAIVLAGIACGGFAAAHWLERRPDGHRHAGTVAFAAGLCCVASYATAPLFLAPFGMNLVVGPRAIAEVGVPLMFPVSFLSGVFFTLIGAALRSDAPSDSAAVGALTFANTVGAALGSLAGGFVLLPVFGMENAIYVAALCYGGIGAWVLLRDPARRNAALFAAAVGFAAAVALFPFGSMESRHLPITIKRWIKSPEDRVAAVRESPAQTLVYIEQRKLGEVHAHRVITNALSMAGSSNNARRYSKLYVYLPVALHPGPKRGLVISYGLGSTAKALTDTGAFESIDIVDISEEMLEMSGMVYAEGDSPLRDPRVEVHVEDGRYFLQGTDRRFDLITGEPPPPAAAGVVNLYTREYFELVRDRLTEGGMVTYWLPIHSVSEGGSRAIVRAFCDAFEDCSLWNGTGQDMMLVGTRNARERVSAEHFARQWRDPVVAEELLALGFEHPAQLGALFVAGAAYLNELTGADDPLVDDFPKRIVGPLPDLDDLSPMYRSWADAVSARERFRTSSFIAALWPEALREPALAYFDAQQVINNLTFGLHPANRSRAWDTHTILSETKLTAPAMWLLGTNADYQRIVAEAEGKALTNPNLQYHRGVALVAQRRYDDALEPLRLAEGNPHNFTVATSIRILALCEAGRPEEAQALAHEHRSRMAGGARMQDYWAAMNEICGIAPLEVAYAGDE
jgi:predicted membrane-bound spermidine synthase